MNKLLIFRRIFSLSVVFTFIIFSVSTKTLALSKPPQEAVTDFKANYLIQKNGDVKVEERISYFYPEQKHGIIRDIPFKKANTSGFNYLMDIKDINVTVDNSPNVPYNISKTNGFYSIKIGDPNETIIGPHEYVISYVVIGGLTYFGDHDELYWNVTGDQWEVPIEAAQASVSFEPFVEARDINVKCYTGRTNSEQENCSALKTNTPSVSIDSIGILSPGEQLTFVVGFPKDLVAKVEPKRDLLAQLFLYLTFIIGGAWYVLLPLYLVFLFLKSKADFDRKKKILPAWFSPPQNPVKNDYSPAQTGYIYSNRVDNKSITATIISLAQKGYIKIKVESKNDVSFYLQNSVEPIDDYERILLVGLFNNGKIERQLIQNLKYDTRFGEKIEQFKAVLVKGVNADGLFKRDPGLHMGIYVFIAVASLILGFNIPLLIISLVNAFFIVPRTDLGIEKYSEAASLKNFLVSQDAQLDFQAENQMYFEKLLPYATVFGVEDVWIKRFGNLNIKVPEWFEGNVSNLYVLSAISHSINSSVRSASVYTSSRSSSGFSSGFSGGHAGGGGGGGGGHSW